ncbi:MAG: hypothetical protein ACREDR_00675 [Blastocatellia bacterium]
MRLPKDDKEYGSAEQDGSGKLLVTARECSKFLLKKCGLVRPFGLVLERAGQSVRSFYPKDTGPDATWLELLGLAERELRAAIESGDAAGVALVTGLESDSDTAIGVQVETASMTLFLLYRYRKGLLGWRLDEPDSPGGFLIDPPFYPSKV